MKIKKLYLAIIPALFFQFIGALLYLKLFSNSQIAQYIYSLTKILIVIWPLFWLFLGLKTKLKNLPHRKQSIIYGIISGILISTIILATFFIFREYFNDLSTIITDRVESFGIKNYYILFSIFLSLIHSFIEEFYWRWFVFGNLLKKFSFKISAIIASIGFGLHHFILLSQFFSPIITALFGSCVILGGIIWCWTYKKTGSLLGSWVSHVFVDATIMYIGYLLIFT